MTNPDLVTERILRAKIVVIFRGLDPDRCAWAADALYAAGLRAFEVTLNSGGALDAIRTVRSALPEDAVVGVGTVLTPDEVDAARGCGAEFVVAPNVDVDVVARTRAAGLTSIPGAQTATEVLRARRAGADIVKIFPIRPLGADYLGQLRGPIADVPFLATGGVDAALARACLAAGANAVGVGSHLIAGGPLPDAQRTLTDLGRRFRTLASGEPTNDEGGEPTHAR